MDLPQMRAVGVQVNQVNIVMSDGLEIKLTKIVSRFNPPYNLGELPRHVIWQAERIYPVHKMHSSFTRVARGFGVTQSEAIAHLYTELDDTGELDNDYLPCEDCQKGYRIVSTAEAYIPHDDKCPAMAGKAGE
jgi:hypothetical protein